MEGQLASHRLGLGTQDVLQHRTGPGVGCEFDFDLLAAAWERGEEATLEVLSVLLRHG